MHSPLLGERRMPRFVVLAERGVEGFLGVAETTPAMQHEIVQ